MEINIGDIYFNQPIKKEIMGIPPERFDYHFRILFYNDKYFSSEIWEDGLNKGRISIFGKKPAVYGLSPISLLEKCKYIKNVPLTDEEKSISFIDAPIELLPELKDYYWTSHKLENENTLDFILSENDKILLNNFPVIELKSFVLLPFNRRDGFGKAVTLEANNGLCFTPLEILFKIHNEQSNYINEGVKYKFEAVSRAGHQKGLPSYSVRKE